MFFEIACGVVLGVVMLALLARLGGYMLAAIIAGLLLGVLAWLGSKGMTNPAKSLAVLTMFVMVIAAVAVPTVTYRYAARRYPQLPALWNGRPPWTGWRRFPARFGGALLLTVGLVGLGVAGAAAVWGIVWGLEWLTH